MIAYFYFLGLFYLLAVPTLAFIHFTEVSTNVFKTWYRHRTPRPLAQLERGQTDLRQIKKHEHKRHAL